MSYSHDHLAVEAQRELDGLRTQLDLRLSALEAGLASPNPRTPLAQLVLDLARVATAESQSAAGRAALEAQLDAERHATAAVTEATRELELARTELKRERQALARLRQELDHAHGSLEEQRLTAADRGREFENALEALQSGREANASLRHHSDQLEEALERERARAAALDSEIAMTRAADAQSSETVAALQIELATAQQRHEALSLDAASIAAALDAAQRRCRDLDETHNAVTTRAKAATLERDTVTSALAAERTRGAARDAELADARRSAARRSETIEALQRELAAARQANETRALDEASWAAARDALERRCAELDHASSEAMARADEAVGERDALAASLETERQAAVAARATDEAQVAQLGVEIATHRGDVARLEESRSALERELADVRRAAVGTVAGDVHRAAIDLLERQCAALEQAGEAARAREAAATSDRDTLAIELEVERHAASAAQRSVDARLTALAAERADAERLHREAAARAEAAVRDRNALAEELSTLRNAAVSDRQTALEQLEQAVERIRGLELQLFERERGPADRDVNLEPLLGAAAPAPPSAQAGKRARRYGFKTPRKIRMDKDPCLLIDISVTGAQIVSATSPEVGRIVTLSLPSDEAPCFCQGRLLWARREQTAKGRPYRYRTGLVFTDADENAIEAFIACHAVS